MLYSSQLSTFWRGLIKLPFSESVEMRPTRMQASDRSFGLRFSLYRCEFLDPSSQLVLWLLVWRCNSGLHSKVEFNDVVVIVSEWVVESWRLFSPLLLSLDRFFIASIGSRSQRVKLWGLRFLTSLKKRAEGLSGCLWRIDAQMCGRGDYLTRDCGCRFLG